MKKYIPLLLAALSLSLSSSIAQMVGSNLFLKGNYLEVGFQNNGAMGATGGTPASYHPHTVGTPSPGSPLASVYDYGRDGWAVGSPAYMGDYTYVGSPYEAWGLQVGSARTYAVQQAPAGVYQNGGGGIGLTGSITGYSATPAGNTGYWNGTAMGGQMQINKEMHVAASGTALMIKVKLKNIGSTILPDIYYFRSCDPDIDQSWPGGGFATNNTIVHQSAVSHKHYVEARGSTYTLPFGLGALDSRAKVFIYSAWPLSTSINLASVHSGAISATYVEGMSGTGDVAIGLTFSLGSLAPGDSTTFTYAYMYAGGVLFDSVFAPPCSGTPVAGIVSANSSTACSSSNITLSLTGAPLVSGLDYQWQSSSDSVTWTSIPSATVNSYTFTGLTTTTYYRCIVNCVGSGMTDTTAGKKITYTTICPCDIHNAGTVLLSTLLSCTTTPITINNTGYSALSTITAQWQSSPDSVTWTDIAGATSVPYSFTGITSTTYYRLKTTCIATGVVVSSAGSKITYTPICTCSGAPVVATAIASTSYCSSCTATLSLTGISPSPGLSYQWQRSFTGLTSWTAITSATSDTYTFLPTETYYYRCVVTCSTFSTPSSSVVVFTPHQILIDSVVRSPDTLCSGQKFYVRVSGNTPLVRIKTYFGDGTSATTSPSPIGIVMQAYITHIYSHPFSYPVKHVLYCDTMAQDSVMFTYEHPYCNMLSLKFFADLNSDCVKNTSETFMSSPIHIKVDSVGIPIDTITATSGLYYKAYGPAGTVYRFTLLSTNVLPVCPSSGIVTDTIVAGTYSYPTHFYALNCGSSDFDMVVYPTFSAHTNACFASMIVQNLECTPQTAVFDYNFSNKYKYTGISIYNTPAASSSTEHSLTWTKTGVTNLSSSFFINSRVNNNAAMPALIMGDTAYAAFVVGPIIGDVDTGNNVVVINDTIKGPYDPNIIDVLPRGCFDNDTTLQYTVHFENKGNDTAHNVYVMDTLSDNLAASSLEVLAASADMFTHEYKDGPYRIVRFDFPGIKLLDSSWFGLNAGMFVFKIKTKPGLANGQMIHNRVGIYFDNNEVIMTNTASNIKGCPTTQIKNINTQHEVLLYPNPVTDVLTIVAQPGSYTTLTITNTLGQQMMQQNITDKTSKVDVKNLPPGIYSITLNGPQHRETKRFVKW